MPISMTSADEQDRDDVHQLSAQVGLDDIIEI